MCGKHPDLDVGNYENLNPYLMKKASRKFRTTMAQRLAALGYQPQPEVSCEVIYEGEDPTIQNISEVELRRCATVLRSFSTTVQNEIVGACLLSRAADVHFYKYDYSTSMIIGLRRRSSQELASAALVVFHGQNEDARCFEVIWVATMRKYRERGYACLLFGYIQQLAVLCKIQHVLVLSSRTTVGFWLTQPIPPGAPHRTLVRGKDGGKRLSSGLRKTPEKLAKLKRGLIECKQHVDPPDMLLPYYDADRPFRFSHTKSIHLWYPMTIGVDYLGTAMGVANRKRRRSNSKISMEAIGKKQGGGKEKQQQSGKQGGKYKMKGAGVQLSPGSPLPKRLGSSGNRNHTLGQITSAKKAARVLRERQRKRMGRAKIKKSVGM
jgi:hypothetical protein